MHHTMTSASPESNDCISRLKEGGDATGEESVGFHCELVEDESFVVVNPSPPEMKKKHEECPTVFTEANSSVSNTAVRKLARDFARINKKPPPGISVKLVDDSNMFEWEAIMIGPQDSPFAGGTFRLRLIFPNDYPVNPPRVCFFSEMFHPNVFAEDGRVCVDILQNAEKWKPDYGIETVMVAVQILLGEPNPLSPANVEAGDLYQTDLVEYERRIRRIVQRSETHRKLSIEEKSLNFNTVKRNQLACVVQ